MAKFEGQAHRHGKRLAISALAVGVVVFVVAGIAAELVFLPKGSSSGPAQTVSNAGCQVTSSSNASAPASGVKTVVNQFIQDFNSRNVAALSNLYSQDTCVNWSGAATGLIGTYQGQGNVRILFGSSIGKTDRLNANISNYAEKAAGPSSVNVTMTLNMAGHSSVVGNMSSIVDASQQWAFDGQQWQIVKENWNYKTFDVQFPTTTTTFPQWGALRMGQDPRLVSEKSFEWNAGPLVAAGIYAFLATIAIMSIVKYRRRP